MKKTLSHFLMALLVLGLFGFEPADVVYDDCKGPLPDAVCGRFQGKGAGRAKNVILMIGDGMGLSQIVAARVYRNGPGEPLALETLPQRGRVITCSLSGVTDSAAAATALATGHKAVNKDLSTSPDGEEWETLLEIAAKLGKRTGLVSTADITDATPAAFGAHEPARSNRGGVAQDYLEKSRPNLILGGGKERFSADLLKQAQGGGYALVNNLPELKKLDPNRVERVLGLFAPVNMTYETKFPKDSTEPHLHELAAFALDQLEEDPDGFFLMIEGGRIDHACHAGDLDQAIAETLEFNRAVQAALDWMGSRTDTLLLITADHETGGLTIAPQDYRKGDTVKARFTTRMPGLPAMHSKQRVGVFAKGPNADAIPEHLDNTAIHCILENALGPKP